MGGRKAVALVMSGFWLALVPAVARGADFTVNTTADAPAAHTTEGKCVSVAPGGGCTLRAAVQEADATSGASTIVIPAGRYRLTIPPNASDSIAAAVAAIDPSTGDLDITGTVTIKGAGARQTTINGGGLDRVFAINNVATAHLSDMTITGGDASRGGKSQGIALGGGILNTGVITLDRMALIGNMADGGGGMFSIPGTSPVVRDSLIADNHSYSGGGLRLDAGGTIVNTTITGNHLLALPPTSSALFSRPVPEAFGLSVNEGSGWGGGIDNRGGGNVAIVNSTITDNHAIKGGGGLDSGQDYAPISPAISIGKVTIENTIVAHNTIASGLQNCHVEDQVIQSLSHNLASDGSCFLTAAGDLPNTDPKLGPLADNGGPTDTQALLTRSPAIDTGNAAACPDHDQRGIARPPHACDIGAFQHVPLVAGCPRATGHLSGRTLGLVTLGMTRARAQYEYAHSSNRGKRYMDFFCLKPHGIRVGYASPKLLKTLSSAQRRRYKGRVVWASTSNRRYALRGIRPGARLAVAAHRLRTGKGIHIGLNWWYFARNGSATGVLKVRHGTVEEIGIAVKALTHGHKAQLAFMSSFS